MVYGTFVPISGPRAGNLPKAPSTAEVQGGFDLGRIRVGARAGEVRSQVELAVVGEPSE